MSIDRPVSTNTLGLDSHWGSAASAAYVPEARGITARQTATPPGGDHHLILNNGFTVVDGSSTGTGAGDVQLCQTGGQRLGEDGSPIIGSEYHYGSGRRLHEITQNEWNRRSADHARSDVADIARDIRRHSGNTSSLLTDAQHLQTALEHARQYLTEAQLNELVRSLPGATGNAVTVTENNGRLSASLHVPYSLSRPWDSLTNPTVFDSSSTTRREYPVPDDAHANPFAQRT